MKNVNSFNNLLKENEEMIRKDTLGNDTFMCSCCYGAKHEEELKFIYYYEYPEDSEDTCIYPAVIYCDGKKCLFNPNSKTKNIEYMNELTSIYDLNQFNFQILTNIIVGAFLQSGFKCCKKYMELFRPYYKLIRSEDIYPDIYDTLYLEYDVKDIDKCRSVDEFNLLLKDHIKWAKKYDPDEIPYILADLFNYFYKHINFFNVLLNNGLKLTPKYMEPILDEYPGTISDKILDCLFNSEDILPDEMNSQKAYDPKILEVLDYFIDNGIKLKRFTKKQDLLDKYYIKDEMYKSIMTPLRIKLMEYLN